MDLTEDCRVLGLCFGLCDVSILTDPLAILLPDQCLPIGLISSSDQSGDCSHTRSKSLGIGHGNQTWDEKGFPMSIYFLCFSYAERKDAELGKSPSTLTGNSGTPHGISRGMSNWFNSFLGPKWSLATSQNKKIWGLSTGVAMG
uniref:Uncharacterized protein n=1 Tax=Meleagris gallopavo TaxID=9103 RepID=A0A803XL43_MELGA